MTRVITRENFKAHKARKQRRKEVMKSDTSSLSLEELEEQIDFIHDDINYIYDTKRNPWAKMFRYFQIGVIGFCVSAGIFDAIIGIWYAAGIQFALAALNFWLYSDCKSAEEKIDSNNEDTKLVA